MSSAAPDHGAHRCRHCGREVSETVHSRSWYRVDYYTIHGGETEPIVVARDDGVPATMIQRLVHPAEMVTCSDCYGRPEVRRERETLFRPEVAAMAAAGSGRPAP